ncbi:MAG: SprT-like domain-containing protein, partial [Sphingobacterium sp.]
MKDFSKQLSQYLPESAAPIISQWIIDSKCRFKITRARSTKLGDYRAPFKDQPHQITINNNLNSYSFLITTVHEFAHLKTWQNHTNRVKPHGMEWKNTFKGLMDVFLKLNIFPVDITLALINYMNNPAASSCTDLNLYRALKKYDQVKSELTTVDLIPVNQYFTMKNGRLFQKQEKLRKRYKCLEV